MGRQGVWGREGREGSPGRWSVWGTEEDKSACPAQYPPMGCACQGSLQKGIK